MSGDLKQMFLTSTYKKMNIIGIFYFQNLYSVHVRWVPCHHSMERLRVADEGTASSCGE
jgi:hypothetical protein